MTFFYSSKDYNSNNYFSNNSSQFQAQPNTKKINLKSKKNLKETQIYDELIEEIPVNVTSQLEQGGQSIIKPNYTSKFRNSVKSNQPKKIFNSSAILSNNMGNIGITASQINSWKSQLQSINIVQGSSFPQRKTINDMRKSVIVKKKDIKMSTNIWG